MTLVMPAVRRVTRTTPGGNPVTFTCREGTSDDMMVDSIILQDEYLLGGRKLKGWAIDVGSHIGCAAALLLADYPDLNVIAIEPIGANVELIRENLLPWGDRAYIMEAAVGADHGSMTTVWGEYTHVEGTSDDYTATNRFVGGLWREDEGGGKPSEVPVVSLAGLLTAYDIQEVALIKTDCEGGEWGFLSDEKANARVLTILGEWHDDPTLGEKIREVLGPTHNIVRHERDKEGITGLFEAEMRDLWAEIGR